MSVHDGYTVQDAADAMCVNEQSARESVEDVQVRNMLQDHHHSNVQPGPLAMSVHDGTYCTGCC